MTLKEFKIQLALGSISLEEKNRMADNPNTPIEVLEKLSKDENEYVRYAIASNPNTPIEVLKRLSKDRSRFVRSNVANNPSYKRDNNDS